MVKIKINWGVGRQAEGTLVVSEKVQVQKSVEEAKWRDLKIKSV